MPRLLLIGLALSLPLLAGACGSSSTAPSEPSGPATRWAPVGGRHGPVADGAEFHAAFARCRWMAEQAMLPPVDAGMSGPRMLTPPGTVPPGPMRPIPQERIGANGPSDWWPTEARLEPCMRDAGFVPASIPRREF